MAKLGCTVDTVITESMVHFETTSKEGVTDIVRAGDPVVTCGVVSGVLTSFD